MNILDTLFSFQGRIGRARWWLATLIKDVVFLGIFGVTLYRVTTNAAAAPNPLVLVGFVVLAVSLLSWMGFAINAKRWHDRNKSGWWTFIAMVPFVGPIWLLVELGFLGPVDANSYGPPPGSDAPVGGGDFDPDRALANWRANAGASTGGSATAFASRYESATPAVARTSDDAWAPRRSPGAGRANPQGGFGRRGL